MYGTYNHCRDRWSQGQVSLYIINSHAGFHLVGGSRRAIKRGRGRGKKSLLYFV